jgi:protein-S-isoprenylcysteine O-methyltransferase Ste14
VRGFYPYVIEVSWALWALYWMASAARVKRALRLEPLLSRAAHFVPMVVCSGLLAAPAGPAGHILFRRFIPASAPLEASGSFLVVAGLLLAVWARVHLGSNWSGRVALKENHELVRTGPYALARHPIYTGLLLAILGTALVLGEWRGLLALAVLCVSYWRKLRLEEALMRETFGDDYRRYCEHTAALIPGVI